MELDTNNHSVFLLYYHLVLVTKYRRQVIDNEISNYAKATFERISESYHITLVEWNYEKDHVHIMFKAQPKTEWTKFINVYKSASSRLIKRDFPRVKPFL
ncbi:TPA: IS200/IS605 family transposase, partial [Enterococcus faecium]